MIVELEAPSRFGPPIHGMELAAGNLSRNGDRFGLGGIALRRASPAGHWSLITDASLSILFRSPDKTENPTSSDSPAIAAKAGNDMSSNSSADGVMFGASGLVQYSFWKPSFSTLVGNFFVDGGLGYRAAALPGGLHHELDLMVGVGMGYDILQASETSEAASFGTYLSTRLVLPARDLDALGVVISVGMQWRSKKQSK